MRSIAGAPSRTASRCASRVNAPVVMNSPLSARTDHRSSEIADFPRSDRARIPLALEPHVEGYEVHAKHPRAVDAAVAGAPRHLYPREL